LRKNKRKKTNMQKAGVRWAGHSDGDTQWAPSPPVNSLYTVANKEVEQHFLGECDIVVIGNRGNLRLLLSGCKHLRKSSCAAFCSHPFYSWGMCPSQPEDYLT
jgi:hypothetical protein